MIIREEDEEDDDDRFKELLLEVKVKMADDGCYIQVYSECNRKSMNMSKSKLKYQTVN